MRKAIEMIKRFDLIDPFSKYIIIFGLSASSLMLLFGVYLSIENIKAYDYFLQKDVISAGVCAAQGFMLAIVIAFLVDSIARRRNT